MDDTPDMLPPHLTPPIRTDDDLHRFWRAVMGRTGQDARNLWFLLLHADGRVTGVISRVEDVPQAASSTTIRNLVTICKGVLEDVDSDGSVAFLLTRPGWSQPHVADLDWGERLEAEARRHGLSVRPTFLATDESVVRLHRAEAIPDAAA
jgi:hypothetical protein